MTEKEKMLAGKIYDPHDEELRAISSRTHALCLKYNNTPDTKFKKREKLLAEILPNKGAGTYLQGPVQFDYGVFTKVGKNFYANFNLTVLDTCPVTIGDNVFLGPNVSILTPIHPFRYEDRNPYLHEKGYITDKEYGAPIIIGDNCWIAGNVTILAGAKIGSGCVIGAGAVVAGEIPDNTLAYGVPCKPVRKITAKDAIELKKELF